jgi:large subunit ribosomal protein L25
MDLLSLQASPRVPHKGTTHAIRREGYLPVVLYGHGVESRPLKIRAKDLERILASGAGRNALIRLEIEGEGEGADPRTVMIKDVQTDYIRGRHIHADLQQISLKEKIRARVPIILSGEDSITREGAIVQHLMREVEVESLPTDLPDHITFDVSGLSVGDTVTLGDLTVAGNVRLTGDPTEVVASILAPKQVVEEGPAAEGVEGEEREKETPGKPGEEEDED